MVQKHSRTGSSLTAFVVVISEAVVVVVIENPVRPIQCFDYDYDNDNDRPGDPEPDLHESAAKGLFGKQSSGYHIYVYNEGTWPLNACAGSIP